ncbi:conserved hypothetical protein [Theileria orientalis strain Shintoku]|uniref:Uncharacterized protein n=1 Tax=Theileria orientalis strain Shintoku TaxID=869250 RepID=J4C8P1_THEOR|nr:conserved hypothetical protein [Theileria orientalis strain Shintoku]BAM41128.1 conserved hypothetical protein [Theileria orientalis strain Shintoku]|eukprot:XP_009691429.1 conserved hypothetical protein [Theileria orientalis strain Shintoku]
MAVIVCVLAMMLLKCNCTKMYVDVKINYMSEGVIVHHGTYLKNGSYKMFLGEKDPLEVVFYGNSRLYPPRLETKDPNSHQLIVEVFHTGTRMFVVVHNYSFLGDDPVGYGRIFFELGMDTYIEVDLPAMVTVITSTVHLSVDIGPKHRHPFIMRTVEDLTTEKKVTYKVVETFNRIPLDGINAPKYAIGYVYDSTAPAVIGYTKMNYLHDKCLSFTVDYKFNAEKVTIKAVNYILIYERRTILNMPVWYLVLRPESIFLEDEVKNALAVYEKLENHWERYLLVTVDISDNVTSDLYGVEKIMGIAGEWKYALYQVKREFVNTYQIRAVVDVTTQVVKIHRVDKMAANTTVEVYTSADDTVVIVTSYMKNGMIQDKEVEVYEKRNTNFIGFSKMVDPAKTNVLESFVAMYPICLGVVIGDKPNATYGRKEITGGQFKFLYFYLRDSDFRGNDLRDKYRFAYVWERNPYDCGNVTVDGWSKRTRVVNRELNTRKFMIRNTYSAQPVDVKSYEIYQLME